MSSTRFERIRATFIGIGFAALFLTISLLHLRWCLTNPWMSVRLAPSFQMAHGLPIYPSPDGGPYAVTLYGMVGPLFYTPFAWMRDADWALAAAGIWTALWTIGPGVFLLAGEWRRRESARSLSRRECAFLLALFAGTTWAVSSLRYALFEIHADASAHALLLFGCLAALRYHREEKRFWLIVAGLALGTAPWAKQLMVFPAMGLLLWLLVLRGWKAAAIATFAAVVAGLGWLAVGMVVYGSQTFWFNVWTVPSSQPWVLRMAAGVQPVVDAFGKLRALLAIGEQAVWDYGLVVLLVVALIMGVRKRGGVRETRFFHAYPALALFGLISFFALPAILLGLVKEGGEINSASYFTYPLVLVCFLGVAELVPPLRSTGRSGALALLAFASLLLLSLHEIMDRWRLFTWPTHRELQAYIRSHPGKVYCPYDPLVHVMEGGVCLPVNDIIYSLQLARHPVTSQQFEEAFPGSREVAYVVYPYNISSGNHQLTMAFFPQHTVKTTLPELPGFQLYARGTKTIEKASSSGQ